MKKIMKLGIILLVYSAISATLLSLTYSATLPAIEAAKEEANIKARQEVFPEAESFDKISDDMLAKLKEKDKNIVEVFEAKDSSGTKGYVVKALSGGFGGELEVVTGFDTEGKITGMRMGSNAETPGLGDNAKKPFFYEQFKGLDVNKPLGVSKVEAKDNDILAISGATITSRAVVKGVNSCNIVIKELKNENK